MLGVYSEALVNPLANVLKNLGSTQAMVVHGLDGLDEITTTTRTRVSELKNGQVIDYEIDPRDFGLPLAQKQDLAGGTAEENAQLVLDILGGKKGPARDIVLLNAGASLYAYGKAEDLAEGIQLAAQSIDTGAALANWIYCVNASKGQYKAMLDEILACKRSEVAEKKRLVPLRELEEKSKNLPPTRNFQRALMGSNASNAPNTPTVMNTPYVPMPYGPSSINESSVPYGSSSINDSSAPYGINKMDKISIIAEIKKASPSRGVIRKDFDPLAIAQVYEQHGAAAISILTDQKFFQGDLGYLQQVRDITSIPLLRKDFIVDAYQIYETRVAGADALLLIAAALSAAELIDFFALASHLGLHVLLEVHNQKELGMALLTDAPIIGINNRDLKTFRVDLSVTTQLAHQIPHDRVIVSESGIHDVRQLRFLKGLGVHAVLVGEALMAKEDIGRAFQELVGEL